MEVSALLLSEDRQALDVLLRALAKVGIAFEVCTRTAAAMDILAVRKFDGVVVDCDDLEGGTKLLKSLRSLPGTKTTIIFALIHRTSMGQGFNLGANFVMEKPLSFDRVLRCFRAAHGLMIGERRRYFRFNVQLAASLEFGARARSKVTADSIEISSGGMSITSETELISDDDGIVRFRLPGLEQLVEGHFRVVWSSNGRAGLQFLKIAKAGKPAFEQWLAAQFEAASARSRKLSPSPV